MKTEQETTTIDDAIKNFVKTDDKIFYETTHGIVLLCNLGNNLYGFVCLNSSKRKPTFISGSIKQTVELATKHKDNIGRAKDIKTTCLDLYWEGIQ